ncbi:hypothetical protein DL765_005813 [Monosporascus sp. GIB2]|nr:hypothetical protein DL765_005813 [Monosporascus sp. GIB2]
MSSQTEDKNDPWDKETKRKFQTYAYSIISTILNPAGACMLISFARSKSKSEYFDPCQEAAARSIRCLNRNGGERAMCTDYFE